MPALTGEIWVHVNALIKNAEQAGFVFNKPFIWDKVNIGMGCNGRDRYEALILLSKFKRLIPFDLTVTDVLSVKRPDSVKRHHKSEKPVELYEQLFRFSTTAGDVVLDVFAGKREYRKGALSLGKHCIFLKRRLSFKMLVHEQSSTK
jgi:site-specific DNA-methyltransferase (adenine-specific)